MDVQIPIASLSLSRADIEGPLEDTGPRVGADRGAPMTAIRVILDAPPIQVGVWECTPGGWAIVDRPNTEIIQVVSGRATLTDADGAVRDLAAGSVVVLPVGWSGRWDITETIRKVYVTVEAG